MPLTAEKIAEQLQAQMIGSPDRVVTGVSILANVQSGEVTFFKDTKSLKGIGDCQGATVLISPHWEEELADQDSDNTWVLVDDPHSAFIELIPHFVSVTEVEPTGISPSAIVSETSRIGEETHVLPGAVIESDVVIGERCEIHSGVVIRSGSILGDECVIHPNTVLYPQTEIGNRVTIHANCVIGADGFGYQQKAGRHVKIPHFGNVQIEDDVEIGACTTIDRSFLGSTRIGTGTKIDDQVMVAHNCEVGPHNILVSQVALAGSVTTGAYVICAGQVGVADHVHIGDGAVIGAKSGVHKNLAGGGTYLGAPAYPESETIRQVMAIRKLPEMRTQMKQLEKQLQRLQQRLDNDESQNSAA